MLLENSTLGGQGMVPSPTEVPGVPSDGSDGLARPPPYALPGPNQLLGPFNHEPATAKVVALDLARETNPLFEASTAVLPDVSMQPALLVHKLVLKGLGKVVLGGPGPEGYASAVPLWALGMRGPNTGIVGRCGFKAAPARC